MPQSNRPLLIVVTGRPASGKTTLAPILGRRFGCPVVARDAIKEGLVNTRERGGAIPADEKWHVFELFFSVIALFIDRGVSCIAEAAFQHRLWAPRLEDLAERAALRIIHCHCDPGLARERFIARGLADPDRTRFHGDAAVHAARGGRNLPLGDYQAPRLPVPTLDVDTGDGYRPDLEAQLAFIRQLP